MKVPKSKKRHHKSAKRINNNLVYSRRQRYIIVNESRTKKKSKCSSRNVLFDSDAKQIGIDNRCSACISHDINDFVGPVTKTKKIIRSFGGNNQMKVYQGTITWSWADDDGNQRKFRIPNSYYVPDGRSRLLSPQHWASSQPKETYAQGRWHSSTHADRCVLHYGTSKLTVPIGKVDNVATFYSTSGFKKIGRYKRNSLQSNRERLMDNTESVLRCEVAIARPSLRRLWSRESGLPISKRQAKIEAKRLQQKVDNTMIDFGGMGVKGDEHYETQETLKHDSLSDELLGYHRKFGHISFTRLHEMAKQCLGRVM